ncbi:response regulator [Spirosoma sp. KUDC1026]|uniref:response regulator n=1 Tax=Spirosoma sp. KUDC1026 TaxID=2745947 RepID=UPI00159B99EB|nr:response regulator [Spirosoma sp. KUDC1026]QKZ11215.1 response regulator [Spirosoma sp. KUDC1026]
MNQFSPLWLVDDEPDSHLIMGLALRSANPAIVPTFLKDGDEFLHSLRQTPRLPKVVLLDLYMRRLDGFRVLRRLRNQSTYQDIPVVILTASHDERDREKAMLLGATDYRIKPVSLETTKGLLNWVTTRWLQQ